MIRTCAFVVVFAAATLAPSEAITQPSAISVCSCVWEFPELLPPEYLDRMMGLEAPFSGSLTVQPIDVDPLGAPPATPWRVHQEVLGVRVLPHDSAPVVGVLRQGEEISGTYHLVAETDEEWIRHDSGLGFSSRTGLHRVHPLNFLNIEHFGNLPIGDEVVNRWWGIPLEYEPDDLVPVGAAYLGSGNASEDYMLRREAAMMVESMIDAARADGVNLYVSSPYRSGERQQTIYRNAISRRGFSQRASAPPGHSEHQLGTTVDFSHPGFGRFLRNGDPQHDWLAANAHLYGYRQTYTAANISQTGYIEEPWHWRYMGVPGGVGDLDWLFLH